jgi:hypothetical protein
MTHHFPPLAAKADTLPAADGVDATLLALVRAMARAEARRWVAQQSNIGGLGHEEG